MQLKLELGTLVINKHADQLGIITGINAVSYKSYSVMWFMHCGYARRRYRPTRTTKYSRQAFLNESMFTLTDFCRIKREEQNERKNSKIDS